MLSKEQKETIAKFFKFRQSYGYVRRTMSRINIKGVGNVRYFVKLGDLGLIKFQGVDKPIRITQLDDHKLECLIEWMKASNDLRDKIDDICLATISHKKFVVVIDNENEMETRFQFKNFSMHEGGDNNQWEHQYKLIRDKFRSLGYGVCKDTIDRTVCYITLYTPKYFAKNRLQKFWYHMWW